MKIRFITPYFPPEVGAAQTRIYELAEHLQRLGNDVSVLTTFPNYPSGIVPPEWRGKFFWNGQEGRIFAYRIWSYAAANSGFLRRITSHLSFAIFASMAGLFLPKCDVVIIESPPLFDGFVGIFLRALRRTPYVFMVSDLWPESAVQMGVLKNRFLIKASRAIELLFYREAAGVLSLTAGIQQAITASKIPSGNVILFRNSVDCNFFRPNLNGSAIRAEIGVRDSCFLALYAGTLGLAQNLSTILDAAALLRSEKLESQIHFVLAGAGAESESLKQKARQLDLTNVTIINPLPKSRMPELVNAADCVLVPLRDLSIFRGALPTKMFEAMACAKPVVLGIAGEAEALLREADAGCCIPPDSPSAIRDAVRTLAQDECRAGQLGKNGRQYVVQHFSREMRALDLSKALHNMLGMPFRNQTSGAATNAVRSFRLPAGVSEKEGA